ncbi:hypothetical protein TCAL_11025 [Tigriopus californicus]|uniref:Uncharacterized protein n=1 Tax=Tigriopus californicus TaxID=6832 RepID=A0A553NET9_TIGCA|nr:hypothetical protein TCAL_11025 [Tigriopus californicus]|eukprot:TCALIF_11025-PA protein Name:"Protein of unknown function" AED:0.08 eAED:0.08 QI:0/1/0.5/1/0/0.5/2/43/113
MWADGFCCDPHRVWRHSLFTENQWKIIPSHSDKIRLFLNFQGLAGKKTDLSRRFPVRLPRRDRTYFDYQLLACVKHEPMSPPQWLFLRPIPIHSSEKALQASNFGRRQQSELL